MIPGTHGSRGFQESWHIMSSKNFLCEGALTQFQAICGFAISDRPRKLMTHLSPLEFRFRGFETIYTDSQSVCGSFKVKDSSGTEYSVKYHSTSLLDKPQQFRSNSIISP